jgi:NitT/TauT family transport system substrate-binding protein
MANRGFRHGIARRLALSLLALTPALSGCGLLGIGPGGSASGAVGPLETHVLNVAAVPSVDSAGFFVALHKGLFDEQGLTIKYTPALSSNTVIADQLSGKYDITAGNYVSYVEHAALKNEPLQIISEGSLMRPGSQAIYTLPDSPIKTLAQLQGHVLGTNAPRNINYLLAASLLTESGIDPAQVSFTKAPMPFPMLVAALQHHKVDAAALPEPFATMAEESFGATPLTDLDQGAALDFPVLGYVATKDWASSHPNTLRAFLAALAQGQQIADTSRGEVEAAMEALTGTQPIIAAVMAFNSYPIGIDKIRLQRIPDVMLQFQVLSKRFDITQMLAPGA